MEVLDLLCELQEHDNAVKNIKNELQELANSGKTQLIIENLNRTGNRLIDLGLRKMKKAFIKIIHC